jgi:type VI secretion system secreted protein Hcp
MAIDMFLVIPQNPANPPITGEADADPSVATAFANATVIPVTSFELEVDNATEIGSAAAGAGKAAFSPLTASKLVDKTSASLFSACASGSHFAAVQLYLQQPAAPSPITFLAYEFQTVFITKIDWSGSAGGAVPTETLAMEYAALVIAYKPTSAATSEPVTQGGWNRVTNNSDVMSTLAMTT